MLNQKKNKTIVGLDVEAGSVAATEVAANGKVQVTKHGIMPLAPGVFREGEVADPAALAQALKQLFSKYNLSKQVRLGIASQRVAVRTLHLPPIEDASELETAIRFQAQDHIPMPLEQAVLDWEVTRHTTDANGQRRIEVVAVAARRDMLSSVMEALGEAGLRPIGIDLSAFGMIRALAGSRSAPALAPANGIENAPGVTDGEAGSQTLSYEERLGQQRLAAEQGFAAPDEQPQPAKLYCNLGDVVNLAIARGSSCLFTRISPFGIEGIAQKVAERRQLTLEHARQWLVHVGLTAPLEQVEGEPEIVEAVRAALAEGAAKLVEELRLSVEYYGTQEAAAPVEGVVACGPGTMIPGLVESLQRDLGYPFEVGRPAALSHLEPAAAARLTTSYGLALEE